jgi:hypothetical protein
MCKIRTIRTTIANQIQNKIISKFLWTPDKIYHRTGVIYMTRREIILQILCEHTSEPKEFFDWALNIMSQGDNDVMRNLDEEISEQEGRELAKQVQEELKDMQMLFAQLNYHKKNKKAVSRQDTAHGAPCLALPPGITIH